MNLESPKVTVEKSAEYLFNALTDVKSFEKLMPDADLFWIDKCGHAPMMEHPDEFNRILENWLKDRNL